MIFVPILAALASLSEAVGSGAFLPKVPSWTLSDEIATGISELTVAVCRVLYAECSGIIIWRERVAPVCRMVVGLGFLSS